MSHSQSTFREHSIHYSTLYTLPFPFYVSSLCCVVLWWGVLCGVVSWFDVLKYVVVCVVLCSVLFCVVFLRGVSVCVVWCDEFCGAVVWGSVCCSCCVLCVVCVMLLCSACAVLRCVLLLCVVVGSVCQWVSPTVPPQLKKTEWVSVWVSKSLFKFYSSPLSIVGLCWCCVRLLFWCEYIYI